jgi:saccharopine dehydrogenase-like NADP-dependent oxidoreductase
MAGEAGALYLENGKKKVLSQQNVFRRTWEVEVEGVGTLEAYPNRDSLIYTNVFDLPHVNTMIRGTLRYPGWSEVWRQIILLGMPNEKMFIPGLSEMTYEEFTEMFVALNASGNSIKNRVASSLSINPTGSIMKKLEWLGLFSDEKIGGNPKTAADVLVALLKKKLKKPEGEKDMVVLMHQIDATFENGKQKRYSSLMVEYGNPDGFTAISKTVWLPAALAATMLLKEEILLRGCHIPTHPAIYSKVLGKLADYGIKFKEVVEER